MSESSPFRTERNHTYRWPPEPAIGPYREYERVTKVIGDGEPKPWMRGYIASNMAEFLLPRGGQVLDYMVSSYGEDPGRFALDQQWWNDQLDNAYEGDLKIAKKRADWDNGIRTLKYKPGPPYRVNALLKLTPPQKFKKWFKSVAPDKHRDDAATRGTYVHKVAEELAVGNHIDYDPALTGFVKNAEKFLANYTPRFIEIESVVYSDLFGYAGQFDWLAEIPVEVMKTKVVYNPATKNFEPWVDRRSNERKLESPDHILVWGDYKTGKIKETIALQLSAYQYADYIGRVDGTKSKIPMADEYWGVSIREDVLEVVPVRVDQSTFRNFLDVRNTGIWMNETSKTVLNRPLEEGAL